MISAIRRDSLCAAIVPAAILCLFVTALRAAETPRPGVEGGLARKILKETGARAD